MICIIYVLLFSSHSDSFSNILKAKISKKLCQLSDHDTNHRLYSLFTFLREIPNDGALHPPEAMARSAR